LAGREILTYPNSILRAKAVEVNDDQFIDELVKELRAKMVEARGIGIAAPQIGVSLRVFVWRTNLLDYGKPMVNPAIVSESDSWIEMNEGCLSLPGVMVPVKRPIAIQVEDKFTPALHYRDIAARVIMHELDHLNGVMIIDRAEPGSMKERL
jgi:peptide deformylase